MSKTRFDYVELKATKTDEGYLIDTPVVARTGILIYKNSDGSIRRELRRPEQVFHEDSLKSFIGKPITVDHPKGLVTHEDIEKFQVGTMLGSGRKDGNDVRAEIVIHKPGKIGDRRQLSLGYNVDLDETPGEWEGQRYDAEQVNIRVNHLSVVKNARAGAHARLNLDSDEEPINLLEVKMPKIRLDTGIEYEAPQEVIAAVEKLRTDAAAQAEALKVKDTEVSTVKGERDKLQARVDGLPAELEAAKTKAKEEIKNRVELEKVATTFKVDSANQTDEQIKHAVIKTFNKDFDPTGKSADYVQAAFDLAVAQRTDSAIQEQRRVVNGSPVRKDSTDDARTKYLNSIGSNAVKA